MSSVEEILKIIKDYFKGRRLAPIVEIKPSYWCQDGFYEPETHSLYFYTESKHVSILETLEIPEILKLPITSLTITFNYVEDVGDVIFKIPPRKGGKMIIEIFNVSEEWENEVKEDLSRLCELLNLKPDPKELLMK
jgi:hypothetical protein